MEPVPLYGDEPSPPEDAEKEQADRTAKTAIAAVRLIVCDNSRVIFIPTTLPHFHERDNQCGGLLPRSADVHDAEDEDQKLHEDEENTARAERGAGILVAIAFFPDDPDEIERREGEEKSSLRASQRQARKKPH
jgi:hypothetical protein